MTDNSDGIPGVIEALAGDDAAACSTPFHLFAYGYGGQDDHGWGCAYRCLQMLAHHSSGAHGSEAPPSSIPKIQEELSAIGVLSSDHVGSTEWIEPSHAAAWLAAQPALSGRAVSGEVNLEGERQDPGLASLATFLRQHFETSRSPVMVDDGIKAYVVAGCRSRGAGLDGAEVLVLDPHVARLPADAPFGTADSAARWRGFETFFRDGALRPRWMLAFVTAEPDRWASAGPKAGDGSLVVAAAV